MNLKRWLKLSHSDSPEKAKVGCSHPNLPRRVRLVLPVSAGGIMDEQRKYAILFAATILAARKLQEIGDKPCRARECAIADGLNVSARAGHWSRTATGEDKSDRSNEPLNQ